MNPANGKHEGRSLLIRPLVAILVLACLSIGAFLTVSQYYINRLFQDVEKKYRQDLINIVSIARNTAEPILLKARTGAISREEAIRQIRERVRAMTYEDQDGKNYVFMSSYDGTMLVQPFEPAKELTNQWNLQDANGLYIIRELVNAAKAHPEGSFVRYYYLLPGVHAMQEKLAYVVGLPELACYIGTGMYMERSLREQRAVLTNARYASVWLFIAMFIPIAMSIIIILNRNKRLLAEIGIRTKAEADLKISEANYRSIFENVGKGIFQTSANGRIISANPAFARIIGYESPGQMIEGAVDITEHYADRMERIHLLNLINEKGHVENYEVRIKDRNGSIRWGSVSSRVVKDPQGNILFYEGTIEDIHARKQAQEEIQKASRMQSIILDNSTVGIAFVRNQTFEWVNQRMPELFGFTEEHFRGAPARVIFPSDESYQKVNTEALSLLARGQKAAFKLEMRKGDHTSFWCRLEGKAINPSNLEEGSIWIAEDVTESKRAEDVLRSNSQRTQVLLQLGGMTEATLQEITDFALEEAISLTESKLGYLAFLNEDESILTIHSWSKSAMAECAVTDKPIHYPVETTGLWGEAVRQRKPVFTNDYLAPNPLKKGFPAGHVQVLRHMNVPVFQGQKIAIVAGVGNKEGPYTEADAEQLTLLMQGMLRLIERRQAQEMLRLSEEKFAKVFIMAPEMIGITRMSDGLIADVNLGFEEITGWKREEVIGKTSSDLKFWTTPEDRTQMVYDLKSGKDVVQREITFRRKDGSPRTGIYSARMIQINAEESLIFVMQDITERKETEKALQEKEERLSGITRNIPGSVFQLYARDQNDFYLTYISERMTEFLDLPADVHAAFPAFLSQVYEEDRDRLLSSIREAIAGGSSWNFEGRIIRPQYGIMWFQGLATPTQHEHGLILNGIFLDITQRKQAEEKSRLSEEKFTKIFMTAPDVIAISRMADGMIMDVNRGFEEITAWRHDEVVGKTAYEINFWMDLQDRAFMIDEIRSGHDILHREFQFRRKDGTPRKGIYSARPIEIAGDPCLVFILNDVTDRDRLEEERRKLEQQLFQSQKLDAIGQLASGVAHDFNNILMGIQGSAALMQMDYHPQHPHYQKLSRIEEHVKRGANLTRQLLGFAREGKYEVRPLSVNDLIRKVAQFFLETHKEIEADFLLQKDLYPVEADSGQIEQVLLNMFINAAHAMPKGGHLHIRTDNIVLKEADTAAFQLKPGDFVNISVSDTGVGMDAETLKRIFEPFFTTRLKEGGSGLGLASAYGIIRNHGGAIKVYSEPGVGTTFNIYLPSSKKKTQTEESTPSDRLISGSGGILLVDDEPMILGSASEMLKLLGYTVYQAANGQEAVAVYSEKKDKINLVLLDMIMPGMSGAQVLQYLKEINPGVKVILSSGYGMQGEVRKVMEMGCQGFIQKPYSFTELSKVVHQVFHPEKT